MQRGKHMNAYIQVMSFLLSVYLRTLATAMMLFVLWALFASPTSPSPENELPVDTIEEGSPWLHEGATYTWTA
ncbi:MAG: hypothetical protein V3T38_05595 [Gammaproteobacteria bacterium]